MKYQALRPHFFSMGRWGGGMGDGRVSGGVGGGRGWDGLWLSIVTDGGSST